MRKKSIKKLIAILLSSLMLLTSFTVMSFADTYGAFGYTLVEPDDGSDSYVQIYSYKRDDTTDDVVANIPELIDKVPPKMIVSGAFKNNDTAENVIIPNTVELIENSAFYGCKQLKFIVIPDSVKLIGDSAFQNCPNLEYVIIGNGCTSIGDICFKGCEKLKAVQLGTSVKTIGDGAFYDCPSLKNITIPASVEDFGEYAFGFVTSNVGENLSTHVDDFSFFVDDEEPKALTDYINKTIADEGTAAPNAFFATVQKNEKCDGEHDATLEKGRTASSTFSGVDIGVCTKCNQIVIKENNDVPPTKLNVAGLILGIAIALICVVFVIMTLIYNKKVVIRRNKAIDEWAKDHPEDIPNQYQNRIARKKERKKAAKAEKKAAKNSK